MRGRNTGCTLTPTLSQREREKPSFVYSCGVSGALASQVLPLEAPSPRGEGWDEGAKHGLYPHPNPLPTGEGEAIFRLFLWCVWCLCQPIIIPATPRATKAIT